MASEVRHPIALSFDALKRLVPHGRALPHEVWQSRHRGITGLLVLHIAGLFLFAVIRGYDVGHSLQEISALVVTALLASWTARGRTFRSGSAVLGLVMASALLVHFSGGAIEAHFHFFAMIAVITLYQDWWPFTLALGFVLIHHGVIGAIDPGSVYNHAAAVSHPWRWATIHAVFVLFAAAANVYAWRLNEASRDYADGVEREREKTLSLLAATLESTADGILVVDAEGRIKSFNHKFIEMWGIPEDVVASGDDERAIGFVLGQLADPEGFLAKVRELYARADAESYDELRFKDGRVFERFSKPQKVDGISVGRVWSFRDVTERRLLDTMKNDFLSAVSHELKTPLTAVLGYAVTLERMDASLSADERRELFTRLVGSARKLDRLMTDTIDFDRLRRGILEPHRVQTNIGDLIRAAISDNDVLLARRIEVLHCDVIAHIDRAQVERIVENLLMNAVRHTPPGSPVSVGAELVDGGVAITVNDRGPGVADDQKRAIFDPFSQGEVERHSPGVGIGLSLVTRFAELHGGKAWVEDRPGGGSSFRVFLADHGSRAASPPTARAG